MQQQSGMQIEEKTLRHYFGFCYAPTTNDEDKWREKGRSPSALPG